ncbi:Flavorubredoxin [Pseudomonas syringae pv. actinidiae]|uniref:Flavorubredoxin n=1 Tax=Pseudomonas syringae pv. actinidiae TaxID=103796 RepID=A0A2V0QGX1_PSESF|nr:Flavorubredoxin [Pseudomonas syringae pv. actinidiae]
MALVVADERLAQPCLQCRSGLVRELPGTGSKSSAPEPALITAYTHKSGAIPLSCGNG